MGPPATLLDMTAEELYRQRRHPFCTGSMRAVYKDAVARHIETEPRRLSSRKRFPLQGSTRHGYEIPWTSRLASTSKGIGTICRGIRDISERKRLDETLRQGCKLEKPGVPRAYCA